MSTYIQAHGSDVTKSFVGNHMILQRNGKFFDDVNWYVIRAGELHIHV